MFCNKCNINKSLECFTYYIRKQKKIYYLSCEDCRTKNKEKKEEIKQKQKEEYEKRKEMNLVYCDCGGIYVAFREHHILRHNNSKQHLNAKI